MTIQLTQSYDADFVTLLEKLRTKYPAELFFLEGIHPDQLDINEVSRNYFKSSERKGSATADHSIDPNANVSGRDVITFNYEVPKALMKLNSLYNLWRMLDDVYGSSAAVMLEDEISGALYINDVWDIGRPYCFNFSTLDIALEGLKMGGRLTIDPPKSLNAFLRQVEQFTVYAANSTLGATGLADLLIVAAWYVDEMLRTGKDHHITIAEEGYTCRVNEKQVWVYVKEALTSLIYTLNWEFRGNQSPFTNVSVYDRYFLEQLLPSYKIQDRSPNIHTVELVQEVFLGVFNDVLARTPATFPVVTACLSVEKTDGVRTIRDTHFLRKISRHNLKYGFINIYCGESSTLSSCCRLRSNISDLGYANTFGAGGTKIGSLGVVTLNLPRYAHLVNKQTSNIGREDAFCVFLRRVYDYAHTAGRVNHAKRTFIEDRIKRNSLPLYSLGFMDVKRQYSTCGFTGLYEALEILGYDMRTQEGLDAAEDTLITINEANASLTHNYGTPHNMEQVPAESSAVKLAAKDKLLGLNPEDYPLYSNQFIPLWEEDVDILDRIKVQGALDKYCTGGAICHLNIGTAITSTNVMEALITHACESGAVYFAVNYQINKCTRGHMTVGRSDECFLCGSAITDTYTRVVGFLTNTKHWNKTRRDHDWPERKFA